MNHVRLGIIGMGNIGKYHAEYLLNHKIRRCELTAVCNAFPAALDRYKPPRIFGDGEELIKSGEVDAVIIATPHFQHTTIGIAALEAGVHAMVEKPIASHKADAERLIAAHRRNPKVVLAGMFQQRTEPRYLRIQKLIQAGDLGQTVRINWINTDWYRTEAYYASAGWRATWKGEGGGVLLNQCMHNLDTLQWLCGMPSAVCGFCQLGRYHQIEVEDNVTAYMEWADGATGVFVSSTGEAPGTNRLEIAGTKGKVVLENNKLSFARNETDMLQFSRRAKQGFAKPDVRNVEIPFDSASLPHATMVQNFVDAILDHQPLIASGEAGIHSVELANSIVYSSLLKHSVTLPMDSATWETKLSQLAAKTTHEKKTVTVAAEDFAGSFRT